MKSFLIALAAFSALGLFSATEEARAQSPNPLMPNLGVPYTNMNAARSMLYRNNGRRHSYRRRSGSHRPTLMNNYYRGAVRSAPF